MGESGRHACEKHFRGLKDHYRDYEDLTGTPTPPLSPLRLRPARPSVLWGAQPSQLTRLCSALRKCSSNSFVSTHIVQQSETEVDAAAAGTGNSDRKEEANMDFF